MEIVGLKPFTDKQSDGLAVKHVGSFLLLIFIATFRPSAIWPEFTLSLEPISVLLIGLLLGYKIFLTIGFVSFWQKYRLVLSLLTIYFCISFISLYFNRHRYADIAEIIRYGITFIVITASFPAALFLFMLPQNERGFSLSRGRFSHILPWVVFLFLSLLVLWQRIDFESSKMITQYFVAAEIWPAQNVSGFFRVRTDAASVLGVAFVSCLCAFISCYRGLKTNRVTLTFIATSLLLFIAGILTGGRVFILVLLVATIVAVVRLVKKHPANIILLVSGTIILFLVTPLILPYERIDDSSSFLAYMLPYRIGETVFWADLVPNFSSSAFSYRATLWQHAVSLLDSNWIFGVSNGGFRLSYENVYQNSHTVLLQPLIEGGVLGVGVLILLMVKVLSSIRMSFMGALVTFTVFICLQVDYQLDHSVPWNVAVAYLLIFSIQQSKVENKFGDACQNNYFCRLKIPAGFILKVTVVIGVTLLAIYAYRVSDKQSLSLDQRLNSFIVSRTKASLTLIDEKLSYTINYKGNSSSDKFFLVNMLDFSKGSACLYSYGHHRFIQETSSIDKSVDYSEFSHGNQTIGVYNADDLSCDVSQYPQFDALMQHKWLSNNSHFIYRSDRNDWALWWSTIVNSSLFYAKSSTYKFSYEAKGSIAYEQWPVLRLSIKDRDGSVLAETTADINSKLAQQYHFEFEVEKPTLLYLELSYVNDDRDLVKGEDRNLWLFPQTFELTKQ